MNAIITNKPARRAALDSVQRLSIINRVLQTAYLNSESWGDQGLGSVLAYLALAISDGKPDSFVDWTSENGGDEATVNALALFRKWFAENDGVWWFIKVDGDED